MFINNARNTSIGSRDNSMFENKKQKRVKISSNMQKFY